MVNRTGLKTIAVTGCAAIVATTALAAAPADAASGTESVTVAGRVGIGGGFNAFKIDAHASRTASGAVSGYFSGSGELTGGGLTVPTPVSFAGPVTCLTVHGDTAAFSYPLSKVTPAALQPVLGLTSIEITVKQGTAGKPAKIGFVGPIPTALAKTCAPSPAVFTLQGSASVTAG